MFGFLKDKLKKAIGAFSKSAESEVKEEKVVDEKAIEAAKKEEKRILERAKPTAKKEEREETKPEPKKEEKRKEETRIPGPKKETEKEEPRHERKPEPKKEAPPKGTTKAEPRIPASRSKKESVMPTPKKEELKKEEKKEEPKPEEKKGFFSKIFGKKEEERKAEPRTPSPSRIPAEEKAKEAIGKALSEKEETTEKKKEILAVESAVPKRKDETAAEEETAERTGFFGKFKDAFTKKTLTQEKFDELFWELEVAMLENNVAVEVIEKIKGDLKDELTSGKVSRMGLDGMIQARLRRSIEELFDVEGFDLIERVKRGKKPFKICMIGVNGSGKTTTLAKLIHLLQKNDLTCVVAASDTFRAAAIDQLQEHCDRLGVKLISQGYNADPAAVAFDAIRHAEAKGIDVVLIDTAGRLHSNTNLMAELEKVVRVSKPDLKVFVGESITGNDCVEQATVFNRLVGIDAIILSKADIDEKGGAAISVSYVTKKPILFLGMGQTYDDLVPFDKEKIIEGLEL